VLQGLVGGIQAGFDELTRKKREEDEKKKNDRQNALLEGMGQGRADDKDRLEAALPRAATKNTGGFTPDFLSGLPEEVKRALGLID
jgi:hypothetical protein